MDQCIEDEKPIPLKPTTEVSNNVETEKVVTEIEPVQKVEKKCKSQNEIEDFFKKE